MRRIVWGVAVSFALACTAGAPHRAAPRAIVLVSLDTLRADRLGSYGYARDTAPFLSGFAREALQFDRVSAQATHTLISHKSLFTSRYPLRLLHQQTGAGLQQLARLEKPADVVVRSFRRVEPALVSRLRDAGWVTAAFTDGGWMRKSSGFTSGFVHFDASAGHLEQIVPRTLGWLRDHLPSAERPLFLFVHAYDIHCPYVSREPYDSRFCTDHASHLDLSGKCAKTDLLKRELGERDLRAISDHYDGGIASADAWIADFFSGLRELSLYDDALIVVTSDHGESLGERGNIGHGGLVLEQLEIPLIVKFPASWSIEPGHVTAPVELVDVMPTVLDVASVPLPADLDGRSLLPLLAGSTPARSHLTAQLTFRDGRGAVTSLTRSALLRPGQWLVVHDPATSEIQAFDLARDPRGLVDVAAEAGARLDADIAWLRARELAMTSAETTAQETREVPRDPAPSPDEIEELRRLGYTE